jgi:hypothetical protein
MWTENFEQLKNPDARKEILDKFDYKKGNGKKS